MDAIDLLALLSREHLRKRPKTKQTFETGAAARARHLTWEERGRGGLGTGIAAARTRQHEEERIPAEAGASRDPRAGCRLPQASSHGCGATSAVSALSARQPPAAQHPSRSWHGRGRNKAKLLPRCFTGACGQRSGEQNSLCVQLGDPGCQRPSSKERGSSKATCVSPAIHPGQTRHLPQQRRKASEDGEVPEPQPPTAQAAQPAALPEPAARQDGASGRGGGSPARNQPAGPRAGSALLAQDQLQPPAPATGAAPEGAVAGPLRAADLPCQEELQQHFCKLTG